MYPKTRYVNGVEVNLHYHYCENCGKKFECNSYYCCRGEITTGDKLCDECQWHVEQDIARAEKEQARRMRAIHESIHEPD